MTPEEKKERIKYLWGVVKSYTTQLKFVSKTQKDLEKQFLKEFAQDVELEGVDLKQRQA